MTDEVGVSKVILDPSVLVTDEALAWIADPELRPYLVVSEALARLLDQDADPLPELAAFGAPMTPEQFARLRDVLGEVETFSGDRDDIPVSVRMIRDDLLASNEPLAEVLADEWVFITTQSIGVFRALMGGVVHAFNAFRRVGGEVRELSNENMKRGLEAVRGRLPRKLLGAMKTVGKWEPSGETARVLVLGGGIALFFLPHVVGVGAAIATSVKEGVAIIAGDP